MLAQIIVQAEYCFAFFSSLQYIAKSKTLEVNIVIEKLEVIE